VLIGFRYALDFQDFPHSSTKLHQAGAMGISAARRLGLLEMDWVNWSLIVVGKGGFDLGEKSVATTHQSTAQ
jgi:hypothetical protein